MVRVARFIISGATATGTTLGTLYVLSDLWGMWYVPASIVAYLAGFLISFSLQKFWTFQDSSIEMMRIQLIAYGGIVILNLGLNTLLIFLFVEYLGLWSVVAQAIASLLIAIESFFLFRWLFRARNVS